MDPLSRYVVDMKGCGPEKRDKESQKLEREVQGLNSMICHNFR